MSGRLTRYRKKCKNFVLSKDECRFRQSRGYLLSSLLSERPVEIRVLGFQVFEDLKILAFYATDVYLLNMYQTQ